MAGKSGQKPTAGDQFLTHGHFAQLSQWQPAVADITFATEIVPLSDAEARALLKLTCHSRRLAQMRPGQAGTSSDVDPFFMLSEDSEKLIRGLEKRLNTALHCLTGYGEEAAAFVRLDTRSPKDGIFVLPRVKDLIRKAILARGFPAGPWSEEVQSYDVACVHRAIIEAQRVKSGREALDLLRHSERVEADLVLGQAVNNGSARAQLALRRWDSRVDPLCEMRAFVCKGRVTGITQYYRTCMVPSLLQQRTLACRLVCEAVAQLHDRLGELLADVPLYSADFALISAASTPKFDQALLVEINPPPPVSGTILFDWDRAKDRAILEGTAARSVATEPALPEMRLVEKPVPWEAVPFHKPLKDLVDKLRGRERRRQGFCGRCCRRNNWHHKIHLE